MNDGRGDVPWPGVDAVLVLDVHHTHAIINQVTDRLQRDLDERNADNGEENTEQLPRLSLGHAVGHSQRMSIA